MFLVPAEFRRGDRVPLELGSQMLVSEAPCGYWEWNLGSLKEQVLLTTEISLQPHISSPEDSDRHSGVFLE